MEETTAIQKKEKSEVLSMAFSYKTFVDYGKIIIGRIERNQLELARLCYRANQELSQQGYRSDLDSYKTDITSSTSGQSYITKTFRDFCSDIGISKSYGYKVLATYNADEDRLYTKDELKAMAEEAWEALCEEIHEHRTHGEPDWKPNDKWGLSVELKYEQWLIDNGYKARPVIDSSSADPVLPYDAYPVSGPFTFDFIDSVGRYCNEETRGEGAVRFYDMCQRYKKRIPKGIEPNSVFRIPVMVKGAIAQLPKEARKDATILVANILRDYVEDEV